MSEAKFLKIVFENCESIIVPLERILTLEYGELTPINYEYVEENSYVSNQIHLGISYEHEDELNYSTNSNEYPLGMFIKNPTSNHVTERPNILGSIFKNNDIVKIRVLDEKEQSLKVIYVPWGDNDEYRNTLMSTRTENGVLEIKIGK